MLLDRDREVQLLTGLVADGGVEGRVVLIHGEAGVGKTSLVRAVVDEIGDRAHVVTGACDDLLTPRPLSPFHDMARTEPSLATPLTAGDRDGLFAASLELLMNPSPPTVMVIEDVQWAADATLDAITHLARRIGDTSGMIVLTYRSEEVDDAHPLRPVLAAIPPSSVTRIELGGLSAAAVGVILEHTAHDVNRVMALTDGNPLFVTELADAPPGEVPTSIADATLGRLARLDDRAHDLVRTLSVIPEPSPLAWVLQLADDADTVLAEGASCGLLAIDDTVRFRHELIRRAVEASLNPVERIAANCTVLAALPPDSDPARLAHHALEAEDLPAILRHAPVAAAAAAAADSFSETCQLYVALEPHLDLLDRAVRGELLESAGRAARRAPIPLEQNLDLQRLRVEHHRQSGDHLAAAAALADLATVLSFPHRTSEARSAAEEALELVGPNADPVHQLPAVVALSRIAMMDLDVERIRRWGRRALTIAEEIGHDEMVVESLVTLAIAEDTHDYPAGEHLFDEAAERAAAIGKWFEQRRVWQNRAFCAIEALALSAGTEHAQRAVEVVPEHGLYGGGNYALAVRAKALEATGDWEAAERQARETWDREPPGNFVCLPIIGAIEARLGRPTARHTVSEAWRQTVATKSLMRFLPAAATFAEYAWITGDADVPFQELAEVRYAALDVVPRWRSTGLLALWLWKLDRIDTAPPGILEPYRLIIDGHPVEAAELLEQAGYPYDHAIALTHGPTESQLHALEQLESLGATAVVSKLRRQLQEDGIRLPRGPSRTTRTNDAGLTAREADVLELLAQGLTNPEIADHLFISTRTAEHHVSAILRKLDVATRHDAVRTARTRKLIPA